MSQTRDRWIRKEVPTDYIGPAREVVYIEKKHDSVRYIEHIHYEELSAELKKWKEANAILQGILKEAGHDFLKMKDERKLLMRMVNLVEKFINFDDLDDIHKRMEIMSGRAWKKLDEWLHYGEPLASKENTDGK